MTTDTWNDRDDYDQSAADAAMLMEEMQQQWTWPRPRPEEAATTDQLEAANLDPGARDLDGLTALERAEMERDLAAEALDRAEHDLERVREYMRSVQR